MSWKRRSGLKRADMEEFAGLIRAAKTAVFVWSMGITQHAFGGDTVSMILNLGLARGYVGRGRCGLMPIRGHSSVQGGAEMGAYSTAFPGGKPVNAENARNLAAQYGFAIPDWVGLTALEMVEAGAQGRLDLLYCLGGNFLRTLPEPDYVARAMANIPMRVHQDITLTDQMLLEAKEEVILLPAKTRYEQEGGGTETTTERRIIFSPEIPRQVGEARSEWVILRELAAATYPEKAHFLRCETGPAMREEIARWSLSTTASSIWRKAATPFNMADRICARLEIPTADGKAHFRSPRCRPAGRDQGTSSPSSSTGEEGTPQAGGRLEPTFIVSTRRGKQFNSLIYAAVDPITGAARDAVFMNPEDATSLRLEHEDNVALVNGLGRLEGRVFLAPIARGNLQVHWPEGNVLIKRGVTDSVGGVPDYNAEVKVERI